MTRLRRLRRTKGLRGLVRETVLGSGDFIYPLFVTANKKQRKEVSSMPGVFHLSVDGELEREIVDIARLGLGAVMLFGLPETKDAAASQSVAKNAPVQRAIRLIHKTAPHLVVFTDVCLCEYTDHGHCGLIIGGGGGNDTHPDPPRRRAGGRARAGARVAPPGGA